jgi:hypothetical protein
MGVSGQYHAPAALYPREKDPRYPLYRRLGLEALSIHHSLVILSFDDFVWVPKKASLNKLQIFKIISRFDALEVYFHICPSLTLLSANLHRLHDVTNFLNMGKSRKHRVTQKAMCTCVNTAQPTEERQLQGQSRDKWRTSARTVETLTRAKGLLNHPVASLTTRMPSSWSWGWILEFLCKMFRFMYEMWTWYQQPHVSNQQKPRAGHALGSYTSLVSKVGCTWGARGAQRDSENRFIDKYIYWKCVIKKHIQYYSVTTTIEKTSVLARHVST